MKKMIYEAPYGNYEITTIEINKYQFNDSLALRMFYLDEDCGAEMPFASLTVNIADPIVLMRDDFAFVDTNNLSNIVDFIVKYGLGEFTGYYGASGFVSNYPLFKFDLERIANLSK